MNPTLIGIIPVLIWSISLPFLRMSQDHVGFFIVLALVPLGSALWGLLNNHMRERVIPEREAFSHPLLYVRWACFVANSICTSAAVHLVQKQHLPFVILLNYLWPTTTIFFSMLLAGVAVTRWWAIITGSVVVVISLAVETLSGDALATNLFSDTQDCFAYFIILIGAVTWGLYSSLSRRGGAAAGGGAAVPLFQLTTAMIFLPLSFIYEASGWQKMEWLWLAVLVGYSLIQFIAYTSWDYGMRKGNVVIISLCADFIPWLSLLSAYLLLHVEISFKTVVSAVILVAGAMVTRYGTLKVKERVNV